MRWKKAFFVFFPLLLLLPQCFLLNDFSKCWAFTFDIFICSKAAVYVCVACLYFRISSLFFRLRWLPTLSILLSPRYVHSSFVEQFFFQRSSIFTCHFVIYAKERECMPYSIMLNSSNPHTRCVFMLSIDDVSVQTTTTTIIYRKKSGNLLTFWKSSNTVWLVASYQLHNQT